jgi:hypothetical protein
MAKKFFTNSTIQLNRCISKSGKGFEGCDVWGVYYLGINISGTVYV